MTMKPQRHMRADINYEEEDEREYLHKKLAEKDAEISRLRLALRGMAIDIWEALKHEQ